MSLTHMHDKVFAKTKFFDYFPSTILNRCHINIHTKCNVDRFSYALC